jgi:integrase/recombinase XerD
MEKFKEFLVSQNYSTTSIESFIISVNRFKKWIYSEVLYDNEVGYGDVIRYVKTLQKRQLKARSVSMYLRAIKKYYNYLILTKQFKRENPVIKINIHGVKRKKTLDILSYNELLDIYDDYKGNSLRLGRNKCMLGFIIFQGLGSQELSKLMIQDIQPDISTISIKAGLRSNARQLPIIDKQMKYLRKYVLSIRERMLERKEMESNLFFFSTGIGIKMKNTIQNLMNELKNQNRHIRNIKQLRASVIANWTQIFNLREAQYMAGHRYVSSTEGYLVTHLIDLQDNSVKFYLTNNTYRIMYNLLYLHK